MPEDNNLNQQVIAQQIYQRNRELLQERRHAEELLFNVSEGVFAVDKDYKITLLNNSLNKMLDIPEGTALGKHIDDVIKLETEKGTPIDIKPYCFLPPQKMPILNDAILKGTSSDHYVKVFFSNIKSENDENNLECLITLSDVTQETMLDQAKDEFLSLASHQLKTPLTIIKSFLWMLQHEKGGDLTEKQKYYVDNAANNTENMITLINDMLNIARLEQGKLRFDIKPGKIVPSLQEALTGFDLKAKEKNVGFEIDITRIPLDLDAYYDEEKLRECICNLVSNALKFTVEGEIKVIVEDADNHVKISVTDTGVGISNEDGNRLFKKFSQIERSYTNSHTKGGTGLGLYIVKIFAEGMNGSVGYISNGLSSGSTFWLTIPKYVQLHNI